MRRLAGHRLAATTGSIYFCDPHSPWQRSTNENTNRLLRISGPKGALDLRARSERDLETRIKTTSPS